MSTVLKMTAMNKAYLLLLLLPRAVKKDPYTISGIRDLLCYLNLTALFDLRRKQ